MGEQVRKPDDWLPEGLPEGWKVEIRVRKTGKKDRYYTDPVNGYIFRSLKDIDRYLLTGKLGRRINKPKPKDSDSGLVELETSEPAVVMEEKGLIESHAMKEPCLGLAAQEQKSGGNAVKRKATETPASKETEKKKARRSSRGKGSRSSRKKDSSTPFFILDPDQCEENNDIDIPNLQEIIDSMRREQEGHKAVYVSAPAIGSLLGGQQSQTRATQNHVQKPRFALNICQHFSIGPNMPYMSSEYLTKKEDWELKNVISPFQQPSVLGRFNKMVDSRPKEVPGRAVFGDLMTDPCIDFAYKTLTGSVPLGSDTTAGSSLFQQQPFGSSSILRHV